MRPLRLILAVLPLLAGCGGTPREATNPSTASAGDPATAAVIAIEPIRPDQVQSALDAMLRRVLYRIDVLGGKLDALHPDNQIRRMTLRMRLRAADACLSAGRRPNALVGTLELWFWLAALESYLERGPGSDVFRSGQELARTTVRELREDASLLAERCLGRKRWTTFSDQIQAAIATGSLWQADDPARDALMSKLLDQSRLESLLSLPLSPFTALTGVGKGGDALAGMVVVGDRAVDLGERYPQLIAWNLRAMLLDLEEHDLVKDVRRNLEQITATIAKAQQTAEDLPARVRAETVALLEQSRGAQGDLQESLRQAANAARELTALAASVQRIMELGQSMATASASSAQSGPAQPEGHPFDVRDYGAALAQAATTARELRTLLDDAEAMLGDGASAPLLVALDGRLDRANRDLHGVIDHAIWRVFQLVVAATALLAAVLWMHRRWRR